MKGLEVILVQGESGSLGMSAVGEEAIFCVMKEFDEVDARNTASATASDPFAIESKEDDRFM